VQAGEQGEGQRGALEASGTIASVHGGHATGLDQPLEALSDARNYSDWLFERARPHLGARVLDLGAGVGTFTALVAGLGLDVVALEPHAPYADRLEREFAGDARVTVVHGTIEQLRAEERDSFDSIVCFNVLEHIADDGEALRAAREMLRPGGRLLLLVPAHRLLYSGMDREVGHERRYAKADLGRLLTDCGYEVETLRYVNPVGAAGWLVSFRFRRSRRWPVRSTRTFDFLVPVLRHLDAVPLPFGLSVWAVAKKAP
jgi:SAM-dependent methyltransferase